MSKTMNSILALYLLLLSCSKGGSSPTPPVTPPPGTVDSTTIQYGTPYTRGRAPKHAAMYQGTLRAFSAKGNFPGGQSRRRPIRRRGFQCLYLITGWPVGGVKCG